MDGRRIDLSAEAPFAGRLGEVSGPATVKITCTAGGVILDVEASARPDDGGAGEPRIVSRQFTIEVSWPAT